MEEAKTKHITSIVLAKEIVQQARILAVTNGETLRAFTEEALSTHIERKKRETMTTNTTTAHTTDTNKG